MLKTILIVVGSALLACNIPGDKDEKRVDPGQQLIGEWNNIWIKVEIVSRGNSDSNEIIEVDRPEWESKLNIKPIRTFFRADSTYNSAHYNLADSLVYNPNGKWWVDGDKLILLQLLPFPDTTTLQFSFKNDTASFEGMVDFDSDGKKDDKYFGRQVKVGPAKD